MTGSRIDFATPLSYLGKPRRFPYSSA